MESTLVQAIKAADAAKKNSVKKTFSVQYVVNLKNEGVWGDRTKENPRNWILLDDIDH